MLRVGLTGNIGSGKSAVAAVFASLGIPVFHADDESKKLLKHQLIIDQVAGMFGNEVIQDGFINNKVLASIVFGNPDALTHLDNLLHPMVMKEFNTCMQLSAGAPYVIMEAAILFESGYAKGFDRIIHISCPEEKSVERVVKRDNLSREQVLDRMRHQLKNEDKARMSDFVINNDGSQMIIPQVVSVHKNLLCCTF